MSRDCPDRIEAEKTKEIKKEPASALETSVVESDSESESDSDSEYSRHSVPTIKIATIIVNTDMSSSLVDCGATINLIASDKVENTQYQATPLPLSAFTSS